MENNIKSVHYNWRQVGSTLDRDGAGEDYDRVTVGLKGVVLIEEFKEDNYNYVVHLDDDTYFRIFNPNFVEYFKPE